MAEFVPFDPDVHLDEFIQMYIEDFTGQNNALKENYNIDAVSIIGQTVQEYVNANLKPYISMRPPDGILYILEVEGNAAGMGAIRKLSEDIGIINLMYNRPQYRGRGYGKLMFDRLLEAGREFGISSFQLRTPRFAQAAQHIYRSAGFMEREEYSESMMPPIPPVFQPYWVYMEKKE